MIISLSLPDVFPQLRDTRTSCRQFWRWRETTLTLGSTFRLPSWQPRSWQRMESKVRTAGRDKVCCFNWSFPLQVKLSTLRSPKRILSRRKITTKKTKPRKRKKRTKKIEKSQFLRRRLLHVRRFPLGISLTWRNFCSAAHQTRSRWSLQTTVYIHKPSQCPGQTKVSHTSHQIWPNLAEVLNLNFINGMLYMKINSISTQWNCMITIRRHWENMQPWLILTWRKLWGWNFLNWKRKPTVL